MHILDTVVVGIIVALCVLYAATALGPRALRARIRSGAAAFLSRLPTGPVLRKVAQRLQRAPKGSGACGGCEGCGSTAPEPAAEIRIPVSRVTRLKSP